MAVTTQTSADGKFSRNENHPPNTWTCTTCLALVMTGNRAGHTKVHDDNPRPSIQYTGFGS